MFDWMRQTFKALSVCHSERDVKLVGLTQTLEVYLVFRAFKGQTNQTFPLKKNKKKRSTRIWSPTSNVLKP